MDEHLRQPGDRALHVPPTGTEVTGVPCAAAETMRRVHDQLRRGAPPSFESLLAYGLPGADGLPNVALAS